MIWYTCVAKPHPRMNLDNYRPCGVVLRDEIRIKGNGHWPDPSHFSFKQNGKTFRGRVKMPDNLATTICTHRPGYFYPVKCCEVTDNSVFLIKTIEGDIATGEIVYRGTTRVVGASEMQTMHLTKLMLVSEYVEEYDGPDKQAHSSEVANIVTKIVSNPPTTKLLAPPVITNPITAIAVGDINNIYKALTQLSPQFDQPVTLVITHEPETDLGLREFESLRCISSFFKFQGSMDESGKGMSCGVEAVYNCGFLEVTAQSFNTVAGIGVDVCAFEGEKNSNRDAADNTSQTRGEETTS